MAENAEVSALRAPKSGELEMLHLENVPHRAPASFTRTTAYRTRHFVSHSICHLTPPSACPGDRA